MAASAKAKKRLIAWIAIGTADALLLLALILYLSLPGIVRNAALQAARDAGFTEPRFNVVAVTPSRTILNAISAGKADERIAAAYAHVTYGLPQVLSGKVDEILIVGLEMTVHRVDGEWRIAGVPDELLRPDASAEPAAVSWQRIKLQNATVRVDMGDRQIPLHVSSTLTLTETGSYELRGSIAHERYSIGLDAQLKDDLLSGTLHLRNGNAKLATVDGSLQGIGTPDTARIGVSGKIEAFQFAERFAIDALDFEVAGTLDKLQGTVKQLSLSMGDQLQLKAALEITCEATVVDQPPETPPNLVSLTLHLKQPEVSGGLITASAKKARIQCRVPLKSDEDNDFRVAGSIEMEAATAQSRGVNAKGIELALPFEFTPAAPAGQRLVTSGTGPDTNESETEAHLTIEAVSYRSLSVSNIAAKIDVQEKELSIEGAGQADQFGADLELRGTANWLEPLNAAVAATMNNGKVAFADNWYRTLTKLPYLQLSGQLDAACRFEYHDEDLASSARLVLRQGKLALKEKGVSAAQIEGTIELVDVPMIISPGGQSLTFGEANAYGITATDGHVHFRLDGPKSIFIEDARMTWCQGTVQAYALALDLPRPEVDLTLYADSVQVGCVLSHIKGFKGTGTGELYGKIPLSYRKGRLDYGEGYLYTEPGETASLRIEDAGLLTASLAHAAGSDERLAIAQDALKDFRLNTFRIKTDPAAAEDEPKVKIYMVGHPREDPAVGPIHLTINLKGVLQEILNLGLRLRGM